MASLTEEEGREGEVTGVVGGGIGAGGEQGR